MQTRLPVAFVFIALFSCFGCSSSHPKSAANQHNSAPAQTPFRPGDFVEVKSDAYINTSPPAVETVLEHQQKYAADELAAKVRSGDIVSVEKGSRVLIIDTNRRLARVLVKSGIHHGADGWLPFDLIQR